MFFQGNGRDGCWEKGVFVAHRFGSNYLRHFVFVETNVSSVINADVGEYVARSGLANVRKYCF